MGFDCGFKKVFDFIYKVDFNNGLSEWEFDHVFVGEFEGKLSPDSREVGEWKWISAKKLREDVKENPQNYTYWFKTLLERFEKQRG